MRQPACVGAFIRDARDRVYAHRRSPDRRLLPGTWDIVGGHVEPGETPEETLAREIEEETGWKLRRIEAPLADWEWTWDGVVRRELDYLVEVDGDLSRPRLEEGKHDAYAWVGLDNLELMTEGRTDGDRRLRDIVAKAARIRLTQRLRLEPVGPEDADDLWTLHQDPAVAEWYAGTWSLETARATVTDWAAAWERDGVHKWVAYDRGTGELVGRGGLSRGKRRRGRGARTRLDPPAAPMGSRVRHRDRAGRAGLRVRRPRGAGGRVVHRTPQHAVACGDGTPGDALRTRVHPPWPGRRAGRCTAGRAVRAVRDASLTSCGGGVSGRRSSAGRRARPRPRWPPG